MFMTLGDAFNRYQLESVAKYRDYIDGMPGDAELDDLFAVLQDAGLVVSQGTFRKLMPFNVRPRTIQQFSCRCCRDMELSCKDVYQLLASYAGQCKCKSGCLKHVSQKKEDLLWDFKCANKMDEEDRDELAACQKLIREGLEASLAIDSTLRVPVMRVSAASCRRQRVRNAKIGSPITSLKRSARLLRDRPTIRPRRSTVHGSPGRPCTSASARPT
jgi:hypothetical protein